MTTELPGRGDDGPQPIAKPILRQIAPEIGVGLLNDSGNKKNTRQLGEDVIAALEA